MLYDIVIIGAGSAGVSAGIYAVSRGKKTLLLESTQVGGIIHRDALYRACTPRNRRNVCRPHEGTGAQCGC